MNEGAISAKSTVIANTRICWFLPATFYDYVPEGSVRDVVAKWHRNEDVSTEVEAIRKVLQEEQQVCTTEVEKAKEVTEHLEGLEKIGEKLTKSQQKTLKEARKIVKTQTIPDVRKTMRKKMKATIKELMPKLSSDTIRITFDISNEDYETIEAYLFEGKQAPNKKEFATRLVTRVLNHIAQVKLGR